LLLKMVLFSNPSIDAIGYGEHTLVLIIESPGLRAFTFTFG